MRQLGIGNFWSSLGSKAGVLAEILEEEKRASAGRERIRRNALGVSAGLFLTLGPPVVPFEPFLGEGSPTKIEDRKKGALVLTSLLEDLEHVLEPQQFASWSDIFG